MQRSMPAVENAKVNLAEVLEVRGCPLDEHELWALLHQTAVAVQNLFQKGVAFKDRIAQNIITPESLLCTSLGEILLSTCTPENVTAKNDWCHKVGKAMSDEDAEKIYVYSLGKTMLHAALYDGGNITKQINISSFMKTLLQSMQQINPELKMGLVDVIEVCNLYVTKSFNNSIFPQIIAKLNHEVLGNLEECDLTDLSDEIDVKGGDSYLNTYYSFCQNNCGNINSDFLAWTKYCQDINDLSEQPNHLQFKSTKNLRNPKERWKDAVKKITKQKSMLGDYNNIDDIIDQDNEVCNSSAVIVSVYNEVLKRRKILELLRQNIDIVPYTSSDAAKNTLFQDGVRSKALCEIAKALDYASNDLSTKTSASKPEPWKHLSKFNAISEESPFLNEEKYISGDVLQVPHAQCCKENILQCINGVPLKSYYSVKDVITRCKFASYKQRFPGPEFIFGNLKPHIKVSLTADSSIASNAIGENVSECTVSIVLLNREHIDLTCTLETTGQQLFESVVHHLELQEHYFFGLAFIQGNEYIFVKGKEKFSKICRLVQPNKNSNIFHKDITLYWRVRFFVEDINIIRHPSTVHLYYLQMRTNILDGFVQCHPSSAIILGGLALQAELGDYNLDKMGSDYFLVEHYFPHNCITSLGRDICKKKLNEQHILFFGVLPEVAEQKFMQNVLKLPDYGCHFHKVLQNRRNRTSNVWLAVNSKGLDLYEGIVGDRKKCCSYTWPKIKRISFTRKCFCLLLKSGSSSDRIAVHKFYTSHLFKSQYLFHLTVLHHQFFVKLKSKAQTFEMCPDDLDIENIFSNGIKEWSSELDTNGEIGFDFQTTDFRGPNICKRAKCFNSVKNLHLSLIDHGQLKKLYRKDVSKRSSKLFNKGIPFTKYLSDYTQRSHVTLSTITRSASAPACSSWISNQKGFQDDMQKNYIHEKVPGTMPRTSCRKKQLKMVRLMKDQSCGLGMTITCGDTYDTVLHGAFVEFITPDGPADKNGNLSPGDQILSVNGVDVQKDHFLDVAELIQKSETCVELVITKPNLIIKNIEKLDNSSKEIIEPSFIKVKTWISEKYPDLPASLEGNNGDKSPPIPKPRKKWLEKDNPCVIVNKLNSVPDLAVESYLKVFSEVAQIEKDSTSEIDCSIISEHLSRGCSSIPDIIPSEIKIDASKSKFDRDPSESELLQLEAEMDNVDMHTPKTIYSNFHSDSYSFQSPGNSTYCGGFSVEGKGLAPGDIFHVVLEKKSGSLGLNIFQGTEPACSLQKHIYIHSLIPGGSAETDGRICSGDKLLEVNGVILEDLSYNEVVNALRESPQMTYLVLKKGNSSNPNIVDLSKHDKNSLDMCEKSRVMEVMDINNTDFPKTFWAPLSKSGFKIDTKNDPFAINLNGSSISDEKNYFDANCYNSNHEMGDNNKLDLHDLQFGAFDKCLSCMPTNKAVSPTVISKNIRNSVSLNSLSSSKEIFHIDTGISDMYLDCAKEFLPSGSLPTLNPKPKKDYCTYEIDNYSKKRELSAYHNTSNFVYSSNNGSGSDCVSEELSSPPFTKDTLSSNGLEGCQAALTKSLICRSTPNLTDAYDGVNSEAVLNPLYRNKSSGCLISSYSRINSKAGFYNDYCMEVPQTSFDKVPKVPLRKKRLKKLEDILNYSNSENTFDVVIRKSSRGLGLSISGGHDAQKKDILSQLIRIRKLYPLQPAMECGKLAIGDIILEVNGASMIGLSNTEALETLRAATLIVNLKLLRPSKSLSPFSTLQDGCWFSFLDSPPSSGSSSLSCTDIKPESSNSREFEVTLVKSEGSLGFSVSRRESLDVGPPAGIYIKSLIREPAISDGRLQPGDRIVQVNGADITSLSHAEAISFLRNAPDKVTLTLFHYDPPLSPNYLEDDHPISKPLRWEAVELLNDRVKHKDTESGGDKKKIKRKLNKCANMPNNSIESASTSSSSSSGKEYSINNEVVNDQYGEGLLREDCPGLHRNQRPKSLDMLNSSDRKRISDIKNEESFHRQASVIGNTSDLKNNVEENDESGVGSPSKNRGKALLKWRGSTLPSSENSSSSTSGTSDDSSLPSDKRHLNSSDLRNDECDGVSSMTFDNSSELLPFDEPDVIINRTEPWVRTFDVELDRKWYGRLGFSLVDPCIVETSPLPQAPEVKAVYSGSLAAKDGRIEIGDRLVEVNSESILGKSAAETITMMRILTGLIKMVFCRLEGVS